MTGRIDIVSNGELVSLFDNPKDNLVHIPSAIPIVPVTVLIYVEVVLYAAIRNQLYVYVYMVEYCSEVHMDITRS